MHVNKQDVNFGQTPLVYAPKFNAIKKTLWTVHEGRWKKCPKNFHIEVDGFFFRKKWNDPWPKSNEKWRISRPCVSLFFVIFRAPSVPTQSLANKKWAEGKDIRCVLEKNSFHCPHVEICWTTRFFKELFQKVNLLRLGVLSDVISMFYIKTFKNTRFLLGFSKTIRKTPYFYMNTKTLVKNESNEKVQKPIIKRKKQVACFKSTRTQNVSHCFLM